MAKRKARMGRPPIKAEDRRNRPAMTKFTQAEFAVVDKKRGSKLLSAYLRERALE